MTTARLSLMPMGPTQEAVVSRIVDGDTIHVLIDGIDFPLRYIGIDAPEEFEPGSPVEPMAGEAAAANGRLVNGATVTLERDVSETDRYGRLLRYVWLHHGDAWVMVNAEMVRQGFAVAKTYPPDTKWERILDEAEREARAASLGMWAASTAASPSPVNFLPGDCVSAYPGVCVPYPPPDLDCGDITFRDFVVLIPDPHNFDGDHNGVGCEAD